MANAVNRWYTWLSEEERKEVHDILKAVDELEAGETTATEDALIDSMTSLMRILKGLAESLDDESSSADNLVHYCRCALGASTFESARSAISTGLQVYDCGNDRTATALKNKADAGSEEKVRRMKPVVHMAMSVHTAWERGDAETAAKMLDLLMGVISRAKEKSKLASAA